MSRKFTVALAMSPPDQLLALARAAEEAGWDSIAMPDSVFHPEKVSAPYPYTRDGDRFWAPDTPWVDPWVAIPAMAAVTSRIRFYTHVLKLAIRAPLLVAKTVASAAALSDNRVGLGVGLGWIPEEFRWCGTEYETRGPRANEAIEILRLVMAGGWVEYHGKHYDFGRLQVSPVPSEPVPIYVGGHSEPGLKRAARLADGWTSAMATEVQTRAFIKRLGELRSEYGRTERPFEIQIAPIDVFDADGYRRLFDAGVTDIITQPWLLYGAGVIATTEEKANGIRRFAEDVFPKVRG